MPPYASVPADEGTASPVTAEPPTATGTGPETAMTPPMRQSTCPDSAHYERKPSSDTGDNASGNTIKHLCALSAMTDIRELISYCSRVRRRFADSLSSLPRETVEKNMEASFYSMKNIMLHMIDNEDLIVNFVIQGKQDSYVRKSSEEYHDFSSVVSHLDEVEAKTTSFLSTADKAGLMKIVSLRTSKGAVFNLSVEECLLQTFTEQLYHLGELIALLWQHNIEPPQMQWFYNNPRSAF